MPTGSRHALARKRYACDACLWPRPPKRSTPQLCSLLGDQLPDLSITGRTGSFRRRFECDLTAVRPTHVPHSDPGKFCGSFGDSSSVSRQQDIFVGSWCSKLDAIRFSDLAEALNLHRCWHTRGQVLSLSQFILAADATLKASDTNSGKTLSLSAAWLSVASGLKRPHDPTAAMSPEDYLLNSAVNSPVYDEGTLKALETFYNRLKSTADMGKVRGAVGFILFCRYADRAQMFKSEQRVETSAGRTAPVAPLLDRANSVLADADVRAWIQNYYQIEPTALAPQNTARVLASGSTSYILHVTGLASFVLKILKPQFANNAEIRAQTRTYSDNARAVAYDQSVLPRIFSANELHIVMEYVEGESLSEMLRVGKLHDLDASERLDIIFGVVRNLELLAKPHLDLSPGNIMVEALPRGRRDEARFKVRLIDFGYNYLLREGMSGIPLRSDIVRYGAPELTASVQYGSIKSDLYSIGILLLDVMLVDAGGHDVSAQLDRCWQLFPHIAVTIEDLICPEARDRAPWAEQENQKQTYSLLRFRLEQEEEIASLTGQRVLMVDALGGGRGPLRELGRITRKLPKTWRLSNEASASVRKARYLFYWSAAINLYLTLALAICGYMLFFRTLDIQALLPKSSSASAVWEIWGRAQEMFAKVMATPEFQARFAGQVMALTIILVVGQYYNGIFSPITTRYCSTPYARIAETMMRTTPFLIGLLCISTSVWFPSWWYFTSLLGPLVTAANNLAILRFCLAVRSQATQHSLTTYLDTTDMRRFDETFARWPRGMVYTGLLICSVGLLLRLQWIGDEAFVGIAIAFLCYSALFYGASTNMSNLVREGIRRYVNVSERLTRERK
jgi:Protein kinase domain